MKDKRFPKRLGRVFLALISLGFLSHFLMSPSAQAAERIRFQYGLVQITITRKQLETFVETGKMSGSLKRLLSAVDSQQREQLRAALQAEYDVDLAEVNRFSYTQSGKQLLEEMGELIETPSGENGFYALRSALTLATADPDGLSLLNFIRKFPTDMRINVSRLFFLRDKATTILQETETAMTEMSKQTDEIAASNSAVNWDKLPDPRKKGSQEVSMQSLDLYDSQRDRAIAVDIYQPKETSLDSLPIVVISNGLGARRTRFEELANHLASYGFAVAALDHPGSDRARLQDFYQGREKENFDAREYIDRPLDITFLLDELTRLNAEKFEGRLDPATAGVFGYSFGGTTALALVGAEIDRDHLRQNCKEKLSFFNISLLYQCRALAYPPSDQDLSDPRIKAVYTFVPFSRSIYGPQSLSEVERPVFWEAVSLDILTPLVIEQLPAFCWLGETNSSLDNPPSQYLAVTEQLPHAQVSFNVLNSVTNQSLSWEEVNAIAETYHQMLSLAFFQVYLAKQETYHPYLQAKGFQYLQQSPYEINWGGKYCQ